MAKRGSLHRGERKGKLRRTHQSIQTPHSIIGLPSIPSVLQIQYNSSFFSFVRFFVVLLGLTGLAFKFDLVLLPISRADSLGDSTTFLSLGFEKSRSANSESIARCDFIRVLVDRLALVEGPGEVDMVERGSDGAERTDQKE